MSVNGKSYEFEYFKVAHNSGKLDKKINKNGRWMTSPPPLGERAFPPNEIDLIQSNPFGCKSYMLDQYGDYNCEDNQQDL